MINRVMFVAFMLLVPQLYGQAADRDIIFRSISDTRDYFANSTIIISGHRGGEFMNLPENSLVTFDYVLANTQAIFEVDVRLTKDNQIALLHDATLDRTTTRSGKVKDFTIEELKAFKLKDSRGNTTPFSIPTLEETIIWSKGRTIINLDVKDVPIEMKASLVKKLDAFAHVIFTVHSAQQAQTFYEYDKLDDPQERAKAYRNIIKDGADVLESDRPMEVAEALVFLKAE